MAELLKGAPVAAALNDKTKQRAEALRSRGITPTLAIIRVGDEPGGAAYERAAVRRCEAVGVDVRLVTLPSAVPQYVLTGAVAELNADGSVHGILLIRPLPKTMDERAVCAMIDPCKDVDGASDASLAALLSGTEGFAPCTASACMELMRHYGVELEGKRAVVVGRSLVVGKPAALLLLARNATVTLCHSRTPELARVVREADVVVSAAGRKGLLGAECFRAGQSVVDVSVNVDEAGNMTGDADFAAAEAVVSRITPVPGGVGPVTNAVLVSNVVTAAERTI